MFLYSSIRQYQDFLEDLEEDEAIRKNVNIYRGWYLSVLCLLYYIDVFPHIKYSGTLNFDSINDFYCVFFKLL